MTTLVTSSPSPSSPPSANQGPSGGASAARTAGANSSLLGRILAMRPLFRWAILLVVALAVYSFATEYPWAWAGQLNAQSDRLVRMIDEASTRSALVERNPKIKEAVMLFGLTHIPRDEHSGTLALQKTIDSVFAEANAKFKTNIKYTRDVRPAGHFPNGAFSGIAADNERIERVVGDLKFEGTQDVVVTLIQQLEASPDIESVSRLKLTRKSPESEKKLLVQLTVEAWVRVPERRR